ncbi:hypothetical protein [Methylorubrum extorquens]|jgi:hypothetical protein
MPFLNPDAFPLRHALPAVAERLPDLARHGGTDEVTRTVPGYPGELGQAVEILRRVRAATTEA